jgi:hypothetical protein
MNEDQEMMKVVYVGRASVGKLPSSIVSVIQIVEIRENVHRSALPEVGIFIQAKVEKRELFSGTLLAKKNTRQ